MIKALLVSSIVLLVGSYLTVKPGTKAEAFLIHPIGRIKKASGKTQVVLEERYKPGLLGIEDFSHVYILYWFDRNDNPEKRSTLQVHPRGIKNNPLTGVFATRSPARPNLIALTVCRILSVKDNVIEINEIDALPDTPVIDLKPYLPSDKNTKDPIFPKWIKSN